MIGTRTCLLQSKIMLNRKNKMLIKTQIYLLLTFAICIEGYCQVVSAPALEALTVKSNATKIKMTTILAKLNARETQIQQALQKIRKASYLRKLRSVRNIIRLIETAACTEIDIDADFELLGQYDFNLCAMTQQYDNTLAQVNIVSDLIESALLDDLQMDPADRINIFEKAVENYANTARQLKNIHISLSGIHRMLERRKSQEKVLNRKLVTYY